MRTLPELKQAFTLLYPPEENPRQQRLIISQGRCEFCGKGNMRLEMHHIITSKLRRSFFERVFTIRMLCPNCHKGSKKYLALPQAKKEVEAVLLQEFNTLDVINIMGSSGLEQ